MVYQDFDTVEEKESGIFEVSDSLNSSLISESDDSRLYVSMNLHTNHDVDIHFFTDDNYRYNRKDSSLDIRLRHVFHSRNGMFVYSVETECAKHPVLCSTSDSKYKFPCDLYHRIKSYYHEHSFHDGDDGDSVLKPYVEVMDSEDSDSVNRILENAMTHYLELYDKRFMSGYKYLKIDYNGLVNCSIGRKLTFFFQAKKHLSFYRLASALRGDRIYMNTLLCSSYNKNMQNVQSKVLDDQAEGIWLQRAYNVENILKSVELMVDCIDNKLGISNARISFWIAILAIAVSIVLAF